MMWRLWRKCGHVRVILGMWIVLCTSGCAQKKEARVEWFMGKNLPLQAAIDEDNVDKLHAALSAGADVNAKGKVVVNPLEYALGHFKKKTYTELLKLGANPNQRDGELDTAVTLAVRAFKKDPDYLILALKSGGDPNTRESDNDPIMASFIASHNIEGIKLLASMGADPNARGRNAAPLIVDASLTQDWDVVWCLLELGAKFDYTSEQFNIQSGFRNYRATPPDSPLYKYKKQSYDFLVAHCIPLPPLLPSP